jgi:hypothetical protein
MCSSYVRARARNLTNCARKLALRAQNRAWFAQHRVCTSRGVLSIKEPCGHRTLMAKFI